MDNLKTLLKQVRKLEIKTDKYVHEVFVGNYKSSFKGQGLEFDDLRLYNENDDAKHIDWTITAKQGKPYIRTYQESHELTIILIIDPSSSMIFGSGDKSKKDLLLEHSARLLYTAMQNNDKFGVIIANKEPVYLETGKGKKHFMRILRELINVFDNNIYQKSYLEEAAKLCQTLIKKNSYCALLSDELEDNQTIKILNHKYDFHFFHIIDPYELELTKDGIISLEDPETGENIIVNTSDQQLVDNYKKIRQDKLEKIKNFCRKNKIKRTSLTTIK